MNKGDTNTEEKGVDLVEPGTSVIELFRLEGVNGYKTVELHCERSAKIVSAENGSGKTTLLNALYGVLAAKPTQLYKINFDRFVIKFAGQEELSVSKKELSPLPHNIIQLINDGPSYLREFGLDDDDLIEALTKLALGLTDEFLNTVWFKQFNQISPFDQSDISNMCVALIDSLPQEGNRLSEIKEYVKIGLGEVTVLYLPTYRRIEAEMPGSFKNSWARGRPRTRQSMGLYSERLSSSSWEADQLIYFGLEDVENQLKSIAESIKSGTFEAYTRIGGRTLEQLLFGLKVVETDSENIDLADLHVVLARLGKANGDVESHISQLIDNGEIKKTQHAYLRSFLAQLLEGYASNKEQEQAIEAFVGVINSYWSNDFDEKKFVFNKLTVSARVENQYTGNSLPLNSLSSGEKQIVSVFARLYLSGKKRFVVLIDEPELSLSMDWQKRFLPDILHSPSCVQMVAITHSPFVFDNELDPYAGPLKITNRRPENSPDQ